MLTKIKKIRSTLRVMFPRIWCIEAVPGYALSRIVQDGDIRVQWWIYSKARIGAKNGIVKTQSNEVVTIVFTSREIQDVFGCRNWIA